MFTSHLVMNGADLNTVLSEAHEDSATKLIDRAFGPAKPLAGRGR
jgi:hypothetical protein